MTIALTPLVIGEITETVQSTYNIKDLTTGALDGTGVFETLMGTVALYLDEEFKKNRITGKEYATVYLGAMSAVLQQSVAFLAPYLTLHKQIEKLNGEIALLRQKTVTELAQTSGTIPLGLGFNNSTVVGGVVKKQSDLYIAQTDGFSRDAEQKVLKAMLDTWSVRRTTDDGTTVNLNGLDDAQILKVLQKAGTGIGVEIEALGDIPEV